MPRLPALTLALALAAGAILALASCGGEDAKLLPDETAREITENLDAVKALADGGECAGASEAAEEVSVQVEELSGVDPELRQALERGSARLDEVIATCEESTAEAIEPAREAPESEEEEISPGQEKRAEREAEKPEKEKGEKKQAPPSTPTETSPAETPTPPQGEGGGTGAPGGLSPATPAEPEGE